MEWGIGAVPSGAHSVSQGLVLESAPLLTPRSRAQCCVSDGDVADGRRHRHVGVAAQQVELDVPPLISLGVHGAREQLLPSVDRDVGLLGQLRPCVHH
eukprot:3596901-Rhodomonas_salina.1